MSKGASKPDVGERNITGDFLEKVTSEPRRKRRRYVCKKIASTLECGLIWKQGCWRYNSLRCSHPGVGWALHPIWLESLWEEERDTEWRMPCGDRGAQTQRAGSPVKVEAEAGVWLPQTKDLLGPPEAGRGTERSLVASGGPWPGQHHIFGLGAFRSVRK